MKSCLLALAMVVVAVVVLVPSLSEGKVLSRCKLRDELLPRMILPRGFKNKYKEQLLAVVICELTRLSKLNTSLVKVEGERVSATTATTTTPWETPTDEESTEKEPTDETPTEGTPTEGTPTEEAFTEEEPTDETPTEGTPTKGTPTEEESTEEEPTDKRMVDELSGEQMQVMVNMLKSNCDELEIKEAESRMRSEDSDGSEGEYEGNQKPWSLGTYGVFQLSDGYFCDSGHRWSRNKCKTTCSAFTDDDITDDIDCLVMTGCWKKIFQGCDDKCLSVKNYFDEC